MNAEQPKFDVGEKVRTVLTTKKISFDNMVGKIVQIIKPEDAKYFCPNLTLPLGNFFLYSVKLEDYLSFWFFEKELESLEQKKEEQMQEIKIGSIVKRINSNPLGHKFIVVGVSEDKTRISVTSNPDWVPIDVSVEEVVVVKDPIQTKNSPMVRCKNVQHNSSFFVSRLDNGKLSPASTPKLHSTLKEAQAAASEMAMKHGGIFVVCHWDGTGFVKETN